MKKRFTSIFLTGFLCCFFAIAMNAQLTLTVNSPAGIAGDYEVMAAAFGGDFPDDCNGVADINGELMIGDDGTAQPTEACNALINDLTGFIAIIDRGTCEFGTKSLNAQNAGASAVIVCNNVADPIVSMPGGADGGSVTVPTLMLSQADCNTIRMSIPTVDITIKYLSNPVQANVLWGANGEGGFEGGLNGWSIVNDDVACPGVDLWNWTPMGTATGGAFSAGGGTSQAPTACTGAMAFDSDFLDNNGDAATQGQGPCPANQTGELISPMIDLAAATAGQNIVGVSLLFHQATRQFQSTYIVSYSNDGGSNWSDIEVNTEIEVNSPHLNEWGRVFLTGADLTSTEFMVKFRYEANYYYWIIDDVQIIEAEANNLRANGFYSIAPSLLTPKTQTDTIQGLIDVENIGAKDQTNVVTNLTITNGSNIEVYNEDLAYGTVAAQFLDENRIFPGSYTPPNEINQYTGVYSVSSDSVDFDPTNNSQMFTFQVTDSIFAKEDGADVFGVTSPAAANGNDWTFASTYFVRNGENPTNSLEKYECTSILIGAANLADNVGGFISIYLSEWEDVNADGIAQPAERGGTSAPQAGAIVGEFTYEIEAGVVDAQDLLITLENFSNPGDPIQLNGNATYILSAGLTSAGTSKIQITGNNNQEYNAVNFMRDSIGIERIACMWNTEAGDGGLNSDLDQVIFSPRMRIHVNPFFEDGVNNQLDEANEVSVYPNPATDVINLELDLVETLNSAIVRIVDLNARTVLERSYDNLTSQTLNFSVADLPVGTYFLKIQSDKGYSTQKFTVVR